MADTYYYDLLGIPPHASDFEIKKGYRRQALLNHPDKNIGNGDANKKFQEIAEAYRVLSDPQLRAHYDRVGRDGIERQDGPNATDASEMFEKMFSGESFQDWVGDNTILQDILTLSDLHNAHTGGDTDARFSMVDSSHLIDDGDDGLSYGQFDHQRYQQQRKLERSEAKRARISRFQEESRQKRRRRVEYVTQKLAEKLDAFAGDRHHRRRYLIDIEREAELLKLESFGVYILNTIGEVYTQKATERSWYNTMGFLSTAYYYPRDKFASAKDTAKTVWGLLDAQQAVKEAKLDELDAAEADRIKKERGAEQDLLEKIAAGKLLMSCWGLVKKDLTSVLKEACDRVLYDEGVPAKVLEMRVKALMAIGEIFASVHRDPNDQVTEGLFEKIVSDSYELSKQRTSKKRNSKLDGGDQSEAADAMAF
ncbi:hypothetical protein TWF696_006851 [Orbilia brochopaga]|uniref:J domain-containing protein n=1 Tax=Orbilia brochopaga TaxID=3140254 RepID=A0AAV9UTQ3_9PEZI